MFIWTFPNLKVAFPNEHPEVHTPNITDTVLYRHSGGADLPISNTRQITSHFEHLVLVTDADSLNKHHPR